MLNVDGGFCGTIKQDYCCEMTYRRLIQINTASSQMVSFVYLNCRKNQAFIHSFPCLYKFLRGSFSYQKNCFHLIILITSTLIFVGVLLLVQMFHIKSLPVALKK